MISGPDSTAAPFQGQIHLADEADTVALGMKLATALRCGDVILLAGDLGAGKTALARGMIRHLSGPEIDVPSPTFTLLQSYDCDPGPVHHFDLYRIEHTYELLEIGLEDCLGDGICLIEWPDRLGSRTPVSALAIELRIPASGRDIVIGARSGSWHQRLSSHLSWDTLTTRDVCGEGFSNRP